MANARAGLKELRADGVVLKAKGNFTYNMGVDKLESLIGADGFHGVKEEPQVAFLEGEVTDDKDNDLKALLSAKDITVIAVLRNEKTLVWRNANQTGSGDTSTEEGNIAVRWEGPFAEEI